MEDGKWGMALGPPGSARLAVEHPVSLFDIESLLDRVPFEFAAEPQADGPRLANGDCTVRDFRIAGGWGAAANAIEQVSHVVGGVAPSDRARPLQTKNGLRFGGHEVGLVIDLDPSLGADKADVAVFEGPALIHDTGEAVGIGASAHARNKSVATELGRVGEFPLSLEFQRAGMIGVERPLHLVGVMAAHIRHYAFGGVPEILPGIDAGGHERIPRGLTKPDIVVPTCRDGRRLLMRDAGPGPDLHFDRMDATELALPDHFHGEAIGSRRAALGAGLVDGAEAAAGIHQRAALTDGERDRFLAVNVLACACGVNGAESVPTIAGGNRDRIHVFARQQIAEIRIGGAILVAIMAVHGFLCGLQPICPAIAYP